MKKVIAFLKGNNTSLLCLTLLIFILLPVIRLYSYNLPLQTLLLGSDDWNYYAKYALEIKNGGLLIPSLTSQYEYPGGFFYSYFVAFCFFVFGDNLVPVYIIQSILLGLSLILIFVSFRDKMSPVIRLLFLLSLTAFALADVSKYYSVSLLSENLAVFSIALFVWFLKKGIETRKTVFQAGAILFLIISILTRPNLMPFGVLFIVLMLTYFLTGTPKQISKAAIFTIVFLVGFSLIAFRNYLVCGQLVFLPSTGVSDAIDQVHQLSFSLIIKKILFMVGFQPVLEPRYQFRPHWMLMWLGYLVYLFLRRKELLKSGPFEIMIHLFILVYCGLSIAFVTVDSYGFRAFIPVNLVILPFTFMALDSLRKHRAEPLIIPL